MSVRARLARPARVAEGGLARARMRGWPDHSRLFAVGERSGWSVDEDAAQLEATARRLGHEVAPTSWARAGRRQSVFLTSHFEALRPAWVESTHRLATAYLHGRPGTPGYPEFDGAYEALRAAPARFARIQVTHAEMRDLVLGAGVDASTVHVIPIGIDIEHFPTVNAESRSSARGALGIPDGAFVVGSFQKDGVGWAEGLEPKLVKGPDVLIGALDRARVSIPELHVLLTGPARGYVRGELERVGIPYRHVRPKDRAELAHAYHALDAYVVASRQEGGPKGVLESLATGIPLLSTRVGQASDIVEDGRTGFLVEAGDVDAIAAALIRLRDDRSLAGALTAAGRDTAERLAYERLDPLWARLLEGFVGADA